MGDLLSRIPLNYEPLKENRFFLRFPSDLGIMEWYVKSAQRPSLDQTDVEVHFVNSVTHVLGAYKWEAMTVVFNDPIGPSASQAIMEWVRLGTESVTGRQGYAAGYKRDIELDMLDPSGATVQKWIIKNAMLTKVNFGELKYDSSDLATITTTLVYDYAILCY